MSDLILPEPAIATFVHLFKPSMNDKYELTLLIDKKPGTETVDGVDRTVETSADYRAIQQAVMAAIKQGCTEECGYDPKTKAKFVPFAGKDPNNPAFVKTLQLPLKDGDTDRFTRGEHNGELRKDVYPEFAGRYFIRLTTSKDLAHAQDPETGAERSLLVDFHTGRPLTMQQLYAGCWVRANIWFSPYVVNGNMGIKAVVNAVVKTGDGTPLFTMEDRDPLKGFNMPAPTADTGGADTMGDAFAAMGVGTV